MMKNKHAFDFSFNDGFYENIHLNWLFRYGEYFFKIEAVCNSTKIT